MKKTDFHFIAKTRDFASFIYGANITNVGKYAQRYISYWNSKCGNVFLCPFCNKVTYKSKKGDLDKCSVHGEFRNTRIKSKMEDLVIVIAKEADTQNFIGPLLYDINTDKQLMIKDLDCIRKLSDGKKVVIRFFTVFKKYDTYSEHMNSSSDLIIKTVVDTLNKTKAYKISNGEGYQDSKEEEVYKENTRVHNKSRRFNNYGR